MNDLRETGLLIACLIELQLMTQLSSKLAPIALTAAEYLAYERHAATDMTNYCEALRSIRCSPGGSRTSVQGILY